MLNDQQLNTAGLNFANFSAKGDHTIGFSFDKALISKGNYVTSIFLECGNDGVALKGKSVPESAGTVGLLLTSLSFIISQLPQLRKKNQHA